MLLAPAAEAWRERASWGGVGLRAGFLLPSLTRSYGPFEARAKGKRFRSLGQASVLSFLFPEAERMRARNPSLSGGTCKPSWHLRRVRPEDLQFEVSLGYI